MDQARDEIGQDEIILRRVPPGNIKDGRLTSNSFKPITLDGIRATSLTRYKLMQPREGADPVDGGKQILKWLVDNGGDLESWRVACVVSRDITDQGFDLAPHPLKDDPAHCHMTEPAGMPGKKAAYGRLRDASRSLSVDEITSGRVDAG